MVNIALVCFLSEYFFLRKMYILNFPINYHVKRRLILSSKATSALIKATLVRCQRLVNGGIPYSDRLHSETVLKTRNFVNKTFFSYLFQG